MKRVSSDNDHTLCFEIDAAGSIAVVRCEGKVWPAPFSELLVEGLDACAAAGKRGVLFDIRQCHGTAPSTAARHELGVTIAELQTSRSPLIVMGLLGNEPFIDPGRLGEMVAVQRNAVFRAFTDEGCAIRWLESQVAMRETTESPPLS